MEYKTTSIPQDMVYVPENHCDHTLNDSLRQIPYRPYSHVWPRPTIDVGVLQALPIELVQEILSHLDLRSLTNFLFVNRRALELVHSLPQYRAIIHYVRDTVRCLMKADTAKYFTCFDIHKELCSWQYGECGQFGEYLYLLACKRVCYACLYGNRKYLPVSIQRARLEYGLPDEAATALPQIKVIPGRYSQNQQSVDVHPLVPVLVDQQAAHNAGIEHYGSEDQMKLYAPGLRDVMMGSRVLMQEPMDERFCEEPYGTVDDISAVMPNPLLRDQGHPYRFMAACRVPWLVRKGLGEYELHWGFCCKGCFGVFRPPFSWRRLFIESSLREHLLDFHTYEEVEDDEDEEGEKEEQEDTDLTPCV